MTPGEVTSRRAGSLIAEANAVCEATGSRIAPFAAMLLAAMRGNQAELAPLIEHRLPPRAARRAGRPGTAGPGDLGPTNSPGSGKLPSLNGWARQPGDRRRAVPQPADRRVAPRQDLHQAQGQHPAAVAVPPRRLAVAPCPAGGSYYAERPLVIRPGHLPRPRQGLARLVRRLPGDRAGRDGPASVTGFGLARVRPGCRIGATWPQRTRPRQAAAEPAVSAGPAAVGLALSPMPSTRPQEAGCLAGPALPSPGRSGELTIPAPGCRERARRPARSLKCWSARVDRDENEGRG